jgi:hypothetical protein
MPFLLCRLWCLAVCFSRQGFCCSSIRWSPRPVVRAECSDWNISSMCSNWNILWKLRKTCNYSCVRTFLERRAQASARWHQQHRGTQSSGTGRNEREKLGHPPPGQPRPLSLHFAVPYIFPLTVPFLISVGDLSCWLGRRPLRPWRLRFRGVLRGLLYRGCRRRCGDS